MAEAGESGAARLPYPGLGECCLNAGADGIDVKSPLTVMAHKALFLVQL